MWVRSQDKKSLVNVKGCFIGDCFWKENESYYFKNIGDFIDNGGFEKFKEYLLSVWVFHPKISHKNKT